MSQQRPLLLGYNRSKTWKAVDMPASLGTTSPALANFDECQEKLGKSEKSKDLLAKMLYNKVRVCPQCNKPNGFTLKACNNCGQDISKQALSKTLNVFAGFMLGIGKSTFPLTISLRRESQSHIVLDDLLALSPCHVNVIPTKQFIPDWRYLLRRPAEGQAVVEGIMKEAVATVESEFMTKPEWYSQFTTISENNKFNAATDLSCGFNFPPSQNQLHMQCIFPVVMPFQYYQFEKGVHFTPGRFYPYEYVRQALVYAQQKPMPKELLDEDTPVEDIADYFNKAHGLDAEKTRLEFCNRFDANFKKFQAWDKSSFNFTQVGDSINKNAEEEAPKENGGLVNADKSALQSYGRPYTSEGKPTGKFYKFSASDVEQVDFW